MVDNSASFPAPRDSPVLFVVTGFGPFRGVTDNPTMVLVGKLKQHLQKELSSDGTDLASITTTLVFETSADCVKRELDILYDKINASLSSEEKETAVVFLHLGVNHCGVQYQVEQCAYNDATFRVPDERGYEPKHECILERTSFGTCYRTHLDVQNLCEKLNDATPSSVSTVVSTDPGRFVCNYTYCYSLSRSISHNETRTFQDSKPRLYALFVHVPPFRVAAEEEQLSFVTNAMRIIYAQIVVNLDK